MPGHNPVSRQLRLAELLVVAGETLDFELLVGKRLNDAHSADIVFNPGVVIGHIAEHFSEGGVHFPREVQRNPNHQRYDNKRKDGQLPVDRDHNAERAGQRHHGNEQILRSMMRDLPDIHQVVRHARYQMPRLVIVEKPERQALNPVEQFFAHISLDVDAQLMTVICDHIVHDRADDEDSQQYQTAVYNLHPVPARQHVVDHDV